jgi:hypothetical protein
MLDHLQMHSMEVLIFISEIILNFLAIHYNYYIAFYQFYALTLLKIFLLKEKESLQKVHLFLKLLSMLLQIPSYKTT